MTKMDFSTTVSTLLLAISAFGTLLTAADDKKGLVNLNLQINQPNFTRFHGSKRFPLLFNLDIPYIFSMNLNTKKGEGTSLGLRVLQPISQILKIFGMDVDKQEKDSNGWTLERRSHRNRGSSKNAPKEQPPTDSKEAPIPAVTE